MLRILGSPKRMCNGVTRRELLFAGSLGWVLDAVGLGAAAPGSAAAASDLSAERKSFGRAKNVILLYLFEGPSHLEFCDLKPQAAAEVRGELKPIATWLAGRKICEHLPRSQY